MAQDGVLIIHEDREEGPVFRDGLLKAGLQVDWCEDALKVDSLFDPDKHQLVILNDRFEKANGMEILSRLISKSRFLSVIFLVPTGDVDLAVLALRHGAFDVLQKPVDVQTLANRSLRALGKARHADKSILSFKGPDGSTYYGLVGQSQRMQHVFAMMERIKGSSVNILITGPSGSGKEMVARALHQSSPRAKGAFVAINCSAIPESLLEGELFGYKKGAFTDARTDKPGLFEEAQGGTLFLDEIGDMPITIQPKILRALQEKEIRPLGGVQNIHVDVRIIAATNQDLQERIKSKLFREDLYYRLNAMQLELPALRERQQDLPVLAEHFLSYHTVTHGKRVVGLAPSAMRRLVDYSWPGNVREMENVLERAVLMAKGDLIEPGDLLFTGENLEDESGLIKVRGGATMDDVERDYIIEVLKQVEGNRSRAAKVLGIGRKTLYNKLAKYQIS